MESEKNRPSRVRLPQQNKDRQLKEFLHLHHTGRTLHKDSPFVPSQTEPPGVDNFQILCLYLQITLNKAYYASRPIAN